jgi:hypothetical protein
VTPHRFRREPHIFGPLGDSRGRECVWYYGPPGGHSQGPGRRADNGVVFQNGESCARCVAPAGQEGRTQSNGWPAAQPRPAVLCCGARGRRRSAADPSRGAAIHFMLGESEVSEPPPASRARPDRRRCGVQGWRRMPHVRLPLPPGGAFKSSGRGTKASAWKQTAACKAIRRPCVQFGFSAARSPRR